MSDQRARFEAWASGKRSLRVDRFDSDEPRYPNEYEEELTQIAWEAWQAACPDVDDLAQHIRRVDGQNAMGAGALAESICEWLQSTPKPEDV